jgi:hypothetical protein
MGDFLLDDTAFVDASELFGEQKEEQTPPQEKPEGEEKPGEEKPGEHKEDIKPSTTEVVATAEDLFGGEEDGKKPESVGSEADNKETGEPSPEGNGTSPQNNVISSFAKAMKDDGYLQNLDEDTIAGIKDAQSLANALDKEVAARLTEEQRRIKEALDYGVPAESVRNYTTIINNLGKIGDEQLEAENQQGQNLRANIIYQDFINKGIPDEQAKVLVKRSVDAGTDKEDSKIALDAVKKFYQGKYDNLIQSAKKEEAEAQKKVEQEALELKKSLLESKEVFKGVDLDASTRQKAYDAMTRIVGKDADGNPVTKVQKYADEHPVEFRKALGVLFTLTNGFESLDGVINKQVRKQVKSHLSDFEARLGSKPSGGSLAYAEGDRGGADDSLLSSGGWLLDNGK